MDPVTLTFYGLVCGLLAAFVPVASRPFRFALGLGVGLVAASFLPPLRGLFGI
jgi:hypothetical protein